MSMPFTKVLVANRGEIASRVIRTLKSMGIRSVAIYSDADASARHVNEADEAVRIGPAAARDSYLDIDAVVEAALLSGAQAVHPGYGFLSENTDFARALHEAGIAFIGPPIGALDLMADKIRAKNHVEARGVPTTPGIARAGMSDDSLVEAAAQIGYPVLIKPSAGGGGKGMLAAYSDNELREELPTARRIAAASFGDDTLFLERLVSQPRHIEVQVLADQYGNVIHLGERECSLQRRHQKIIEEAPSVLLSEETRQAIGRAACEAARSVEYTGAGTVEFLVSDERPDEFFFMEMNTRLQVEHPVTEQVTGVDLVQWQVRIAAGEELTLHQDDVVLTGHAIEARIYAEDPAQDFLPQTGTVLALRESDRTRNDSSLIDGLQISAYYDPMLSKVISWGPSRDDALETLIQGLRETAIMGVRTNVEFLTLLLSNDDVRAGKLNTSLVESVLPTLQFAEPDEALWQVAAQFFHHRQLGLDQRSTAQGSAGPITQDSDVRPTATNAWAADGWRMRGTAKQAVELKIGAVQRTVELDDSARFTHSVTSVSLEHADPRAGLSAETAGSGLRRRLHWDWALDEQGQTLYLTHDGCMFAVRHIDRSEKVQQKIAAVRSTVVASEPEVRSPMPGTVVAAYVSEGDEVVAGQALLAVEAMKMEHQLRAQVPGLVHIHVAVGDTVKAGHLAATITSTESEAPSAAEPREPHHD